MEMLIALAIALGVGYYVKKKADEKQNVLSDQIRLSEASPPLPALPPASVAPIAPTVQPSTPPIWAEPSEPSFITEMTSLANRIEAADDPRWAGASVLAKGSCSNLGCIGPENPSPNPTGGKPQKGIASNPIRQWCTVVRDGDTAGRIAEAHTGDRNRYIELIAANPTKKMIRSPEMNFEDLCVGERLFIPKAWNPWIDQEGNASSSKGPYPPYNSMPAYPKIDPNVVSAGYIAWPPESPITWVELPFKMVGA